MDLFLRPVSYTLKALFKHHFLVLKVRESYSIGKMIIICLNQKGFKGGWYSASNQTALQGLSLKCLLPNLFTLPRKMDLNLHLGFDKH